MARIKINTTKMEIVKTATKMFLKKGVSATSAKTICEKLDIGTGNLTLDFQKRNLTTKLKAN